MMAGHTHGGQIRPPGVGCFWPNDCIPRRLAWGLNVWHGVRMHVTSGIGSNGPGWARWNCPAEIVLLELRCAATAQKLHLAV